METRGEHRRVVHPQRGQDVRPGARIRRRGQRHARHAREILGQSGQHPVVGAELVAPLADAMRLVDGHQRDPLPLQSRQGAAAEQPLRRDVDQVEPAGIQHPADLALFVRRLVGVHGRRRDAELAQGGHLVVHQRDQRRDDDGGAGAAQGGQLVADALAAAGRHQHQRVAAAQDVIDDRLLQARGTPGSRTRGPARRAAARLPRRVGSRRSPDQDAPTAMLTRRASNGSS